ncbi:MerR family transcriptional regulator [Heyndrickxia sporothermodurans]|nr:MerR family transcriptional regulator [Heyndrickxia sporothermodurans]
MYSIGRFSEICNIPVKTLRYYSDIGLLEPSYIDPETNYRYYDYDKIKTVNKIILLKNCHVSLNTIKKLMDSDDEIQWKNILEDKIVELEEQKEQIIKKIEEMNRLKSQIEKEVAIIPGPYLSHCFLESRKETIVYAIREKINITFIDRLVKQLFNRVYAYNLVVDGSLMAIFHERDNYKMADVELLLPVKNTNQIKNCIILNKGIYACLTVKGAYSELNAGYDQLKNWIKHKNLRQVGNAVEIYETGLVPLNFNSRDIRPDLNRHPSDFITKICIPVSSKD